jgi:hypothetical protein
MPEEQAPELLEQQDQPQTEEVAPQEDTATESFTDSFNPDQLPEEARAAYDSAYKQMQADYTRKTQEVADQRREAEEAQELISALQDPQYRDAALQVLGIQPQAEDDQADEFEDYLSEDERLDRIEQYLEGQQAQQQDSEIEQLENQYLDQEFAKLEKSIARDLTDDEAELLFVTATHPTFRDSNGLPDVQAAYDRVKQLEQGAQQRYVESKKAPRAPMGSAGSKQIDLNDDEARTEVLAQMIEAAAEDTATS